MWGSESFCDAASAFPGRSRPDRNVPGTLPPPPAKLHQDCIKISGCADFREQLVPEREEQSPQD